MKSLPPKSKLSHIPHAAIPRTFHLDVAQRVGDYSVAIARIRGNDTATFEIIGSGTLVVRDGQHGVLTAHHCLHAWDPPVKLGRVGEYQIFFLAKYGHVPSAKQHELAEQPLGAPKGRYRETGPDLTFIHIPPGPVLSSLKAVSSFYPLNKNPAAITRRFCVDRVYIANTGYPAHRAVVTRETKAVNAAVTLLVGAGAFTRSDIQRRQGWDYIDCPCDYRAFPHLPIKFNGMSGGGIWAVLMKKKKDGSLEIEDFALVGVMFFQTGLRRNRQRLRGHFVRSIYQRAWKRGKKRAK